jgi:preprotein translocase subunit SecF
MEIIKNPNYDFIGKAKYFVALSVFFILSGVALMTLHGIAYGVEFSGGTQLILHFQNPPEVDKIRSAVERLGAGAVIQAYGDAKQNKVLVRIAQEAPESDLDAPARGIREALARNYGQNPVLESSSEIVGPIVGGELRQKAVYLTVLGLLFQLIYIAARFKGGAWGVAAAVASLHDILICLGFLTFFHFEITLNVIAALLTLVGYSVNDTIVVFDRVRENKARHAGEPIAAIVNHSILQTFGRSINTSLTVVMTLTALLLFGGSAITYFVLALLLGIVSGTYSSIFNASPLLVVWQEWEDRRRAAHLAAAARPSRRAST